MKNVMARLEKFRDDRDWSKLHTEGELARSLMIEGAELNRLFQWGESPTRERLSEEVADCLIYGLNLCLIAGFDPIAIINAKIDKNAVKYPTLG
jgi:NTP pyrophosphatase (non-canonical NTP hydrolase)